MSSLVKEINGSISKGIYVLLFDLFFLFTIKKNWHSQSFNFIGKKIWRNAQPLKSKKVQGIFAEAFILALSSSAVFRLQNRVSDFL